MKDFYAISLSPIHATLHPPEFGHTYNRGNYELLIIQFFLTVNNTHSLTVITMYHSLLTIKIGHVLNDHGSYTVK
jgi:hypothetical protein